MWLKTKEKKKLTYTLYNRNKFTAAILLNHLINEYKEEVRDIEGKDI